MVALLPALVLIGLIGWQMAAAGYAWTLAAGSARAGARAAEVGAPVREAVRAALPVRYAADAAVSGAGRGVRVRVSVPRVLPFVPVPRFLSATAGPRP